VNFLVLGAGRMGYALVYDLIRSPRVEQVILADRDVERLESIKQRLPDDRIVLVELDVDQREEVLDLMGSSKVVISCVPSEYNYELAKLALSAGVHFCDLGGDESVVRKQFRLNDVARDQDLTIIPNLGLAPGLVSILSVAAANLLDELYEMRIRVGNVPAEPEEPLNYSAMSAVSAVINQYVEKSTVIRDGKLFWMPALSELEEIDFPKPIGKMEAFHIAGGLTNLTKMYSGRIQHLDYKAVRYPGHCGYMSAIRELGLMDPDPMPLGIISVKPRDLLVALMERNLPQDQADLVLVRIIVTGTKDQKPSQVLWECIDYSDEAEQLTAMMRMTAFPASIIAQMIARDDITEKGVLEQENVVPTKLFLAELAGRGITLTMTEREPALPEKRRTI
jgi:lysine 6-dehydrogenase